MSGVTQVGPGGGLQIEGVSGAEPVPVSGTFGPPVVLGQAAMADSLPVVLASDQSPLEILAADVFQSFSALAITAEATLWTPTSGKKFVLMGFVITQNTLAGDITLKDGTGGATILTIPATPVGQPLAVPLGAGITSATADNLLRAIGVATETISGFVYGREV
jgi:hypothetical protein